MQRNLNPSVSGPEARNALASLRKRVVGQEEASRVLIDIVENFQAGFGPASKPAGNALFLGPTGSGKTHTVEMLCKGLFGDERACIKIDCGEFQHSHEIAKLIGSPPGYLGHRETHPMLTQEALDQWHTERLKLSVLLFDEIEKASDALWNLMLGILDKATLTLGDNRRVSFTNVIIIMTSNLGASQMEDLLEGGLGFVPPTAVKTTELDSKLYTIAIEAAKRKFTPEFYNRINHTVVFKTLTEEQIKDVLDIELDRLQTRLLSTSKVSFFWNVLPTAKRTLLKEGYSKKYGVRELSRAVEKRILTPLARLVASGQLINNDVVLISDMGNSEFNFDLQQVEEL